jgi:hypothetical protein
LQPDLVVDTEKLMNRESRRYATILLIDYNTASASSWV